MGVPGEWGAPQRGWLMILPLILLPLPQIFPKVLSGQDSLPSFSGYSDQVAENLGQRPFYVAYLHPKISLAMRGRSIDQIK